MKKFLPYILIFAVVAVFALGPFGVEEAQAGLGWFDIGNIALTAVKKAAAALGTIFLQLAGKILAMAGALFDASIDYSIKEVGNNKVVDEGWALSRDIANLFFIFILLYISIATILQLGGYMIKDLLVTVVIIALLVNFSLVFTKIIIDGSNILALTFYEQLEKIPIVGSDGNLTGRKASLSEAFVAGLRPQGVYDANLGETIQTDPETGEETVLKNAPDETLVQIFIQTVLGAVLILVAAFVLFAGAIMFILRVVILWILMILAPLAFVAMILPYTTQYSKKWWSTLFSQSFFAPIFLFMMYFAVKMVTSRGLSKQLGIDNAQYGTSGFFSNTANAKLFLNYVLLIAMFLAVLVVAKQLGGYAGTTGLKWAHSAQKWGQGYAGRISRRGALRVAGPAAKKLAESEGKFAKTLRAIPGLKSVPAKIAKANRKQIEETGKKYEGYTPKELKNMLPTLPFGYNRAAVLQELAKKGDLKIGGRLTDDQITKGRNLMGRYGMSTKDIDILRPDLIENRQQRNKALAAANWEKMDKDVINKILTDDDTQRHKDDIAAIIENAKPSTIKKVYEEAGTEASDAFFNALKEGLENGKVNRSTQAWASQGLGKAIMERYGHENKETKAEKERKERTAKEEERMI